MKTSSACWLATYKKIYKKEYYGIIYIIMLRKQLVKEEFPFPLYILVSVIKAALELHSDQHVGKNTYMDIRL